MNKLPTSRSDGDITVPQAAKGQNPGAAKMPHTIPATPSNSLRDFLGNRFVYVTVSARARGLSVGVNLNPDVLCSFAKDPCDTRRSGAAAGPSWYVEAMTAELRRTLTFVLSGQLRNLPPYKALPKELLELRHVALSGDGEPTLCPYFVDALQSVVHLRAQGVFPFFKIVLLTDATGLDHPGVENSLKLLTETDEIWVKLDADAQAFTETANWSQVLLKKVLANILRLGRHRPVIIQSLFTLLDGREPKAEEIDTYLERLKELKNAGAKIALVQVYSATGPKAKGGGDHLPLKNLSQIAKLIRATTGLRAEVF